MDYGLLWGMVASFLFIIIFIFFSFVFFFFGGGGRGVNGLLFCALGFPGSDQLA